MPSDIRISSSGTYVDAPGDATNGMDVDVTRLPAVTAASEVHVGKSTWPAIVCEVTAVADTLAYANGDVLTDTMTLAGALRAAGAYSRLRSITILDEDDQTAYSMNLVFFKATQSLGTKNSAPNISDANARDIIGQIAIATGDALDVGGAKVYCKTNVDLLLYATAGADVFCSAMVNTGTPTHTASGLKFKFGIEQH